MKMKTEVEKPEDLNQSSINCTNQVYPAKTSASYIKPRKMKVLEAELRGITTIDFVYKAANIIEKIFWLIILLIGTIWACYFITLQFQLWTEQPSIVTNALDFDLADLSFPAMTICSKALFPKIYKNF